MGPYLALEDARHLQEEALLADGVGAEQEQRGGVEGLRSHRLQHKLQHLRANSHGLKCRLLKIIRGRTPSALYALKLLVAQNAPQSARISMLML